MHIARTGRFVDVTKPRLQSSRLGVTLTGAKEEQARENATSTTGRLSDAELTRLKAKYPALEIQRKRRATPRQRVMIWIVDLLLPHCYH